VSPDSTPCGGGKPLPRAARTSGGAFSGSWQYSTEELNARDWAAKGVPMGSDLKKMEGKAPTFIVWAVIWKIRRP
jgi:hypothetical protein